MSKDAVEAMIDEDSVEYVLALLADVCHEKADHISASYQDKQLAAAWKNVARKIDKVAMSVTVRRISR